jgi:transcriptional regulator with XRE-family HTH domain
MSRPSPLAAPNAAAFALRFRLLMSYHDLTLKDVAAATHSAVSTAGTWRNGRVPSSPATLKKLAEIFHVSVEFLLAGHPACEGNGGAGLGAVAGRILQDLELLKQALDGADQSINHLPPLRRGKASASPAHLPKNAIQSRRRIECYLRDFLDRAEREPGGLAHAWVQLRREFPLDLYERL